MSEIVFVDTSAWFASIVPTDKNHAKARSWLSSNNDFLFTTDYIIDETLTLLRARGERRRSIELGQEFFAGDLTETYRLNEEDILATWNTFRDFQDKDWSFTDCSSKIVMEKFGISNAFAFDKHFIQFGFVNIKPQ